jgi:hypothetical protein
MADVALNSSITVASLDDVPVGYEFGTKDSMLDGDSNTGWGFEDYTIASSLQVEYNFIVSLGQLYNTEDITFSFLTDNIDNITLTANIEVASGFPYSFEVTQPTTDEQSYALTGYTKFIKIQLFAGVSPLNNTLPITFAISGISVTADDNDYPRNVAVQGLATGSLSSPLSTWSEVNPTYWEQFLACGKIARSQYRAFHTQFYSVTQENTVTLTCDVEFDEATNIKKNKSYLYILANFYLDNYYDVTAKFYVWDGAFWSLEDTQTYSYLSTAEGDSFGFTADGDWTATKYRWVFELDYKLNWRQNEDNPTNPNMAEDSISFGVSELELYQNEVIEDVNWFEDTTTTLTGSTTIEESPYYMTDGFSDFGATFIIASTQPLVVYDTVVDLDQAYDIKDMLCNLSIEAFVLAFGQVEATVDWELQVYTTEWESVQTGSFDIDFSAGLEGGLQSYPATAKGTSTFGLVTKTRVVVSLSGLTLTNALAFVGLANFLAFTSDTTASDIGLHIGSQTIGAVIANESPLKIYVNGTTYSIPLVATTDSTASATRIYTDSVKALRKI